MAYNFQLVGLALHIFSRRHLLWNSCRSFCLLNLGWIRWKTKSTAVGAIAAWDMVPKYNPDYENKEAVEDLITDAKAQTERKYP